MLLVQEPRLLQSHCPSEAALSAGRLLPRHGGCEKCTEEQVRRGGRKGGKVCVCACVCACVCGVVYK